MILNWDEWRRGLLTLPEAVFFKILTHYLGRLVTPFDKQDQLRRLESLAGSEDFQRALRSRLTREDRRWLSVVQEAGEVGDGAWAAWEELWPGVARWRRSAQERLLLTAVQTAAGRRWGLAPWFGQTEFARLLGPQAILTPEAAQAGTPADKAGPPDPAPAPAPWLTETLLGALLCYAGRRPRSFDDKALLRSRQKGEVEALFAQVPPPRLEWLWKALAGLGLLHHGLHGWEPVWRLWRDFVTLEIGERWLQLFSAGAGLERPPKLTWALWSRWIGASGGPDTSSLLLALNLWAGLTLEQARAFLESQKAAGALGVSDSGRAWLWQVPGSGGQEAHLQGLELQLGPWVPLQTSVNALLAAELQVCDQLSRFRITREACRQAWHQGLETKSLIRAFESLTGRSVPDFLSLQWAEWESSFRALRLTRGQVLLLDPSVRDLAVRAPSWGRAVAETLAPGVYLLAEGQWEILAQELEAMGLSRPLETRPAPAEGPGSAVTNVFAFWTPEAAELRGDPGDEALPGEDPDAPSAEPPAEPDWRRWEAQPDLAADLRSRWQRGLILSAAQEKEPVALGEITEARALDQAGKVRLAEAACQGGDLLEIERLRADGRCDLYRLRPLSLDRRGSEVWVKGLAEPGGETLELPLTKMRLVRRLVSSFFSP